MIVVDTNLIAYAVVPGERTDAALSVLGVDSDWVAPALWRSELRNALATTMRAGKLSLAGAVDAFERADRLVTDADLQDATEACLRLAAEGRTSAYDAEFVFVAERLGKPLVSADRKLARAFPDRVVSPEEFVARH
ncbi:MAG: type II toxin-antitoxin system VapC family toxin [Acidobacteriota bacterium]|nr:type II toxin-antitoxin system VapC family toxin [Acidobacteriota bacterium]